MSHAPGKGTRSRYGQTSKVITHQLVRALAATRIHLGRGRVDQRAMNVKGLKGARLIELHVGLNAFERIISHEERAFHRAVMPPEPHRPPCRVIAAALIWKS